MVVAVCTFLSRHLHARFEHRLKHGACASVTHILHGPVKVTIARLTQSPPMGSCLIREHSEIFTCTKIRAEIETS